jgi:hypothetical protein
MVNSWSFMLKLKETTAMKKLAFLFIALVAIVSLSACRIEKVDNNEPQKTYALNLSDFNSIENQSYCDIHYTQSDTFKVVLKASQRWHDTHTVFVRNGRLFIQENKQQKPKGITVLHINSGSQGAELWVSAPSLTGVTIGGSGDFYAQTDITGNSLQMSIAGSGNFDLKNVAVTNDFTYTVTGSGDFDAANIQAKNVLLRITGSGNIKSKLTKVEDTNFTIAGSGDGTLTFDHCGSASVGIAGNGSASLAGTLQSVDKQVSGSGNIDTSKLQLGK